MTKPGPRSHDENLSGSYALDALNDDERTLFESQLGESEELRAEVASFADTAAMLSSIAPTVTPPARLKADLLARLDSTPQLPATRDAEPAPAAATAEPVTPASAERPALTRVTDVEDEAPATVRTDSAPVVDLAARRGNRVGRRFFIAVASAAAAVALFAGGIAYGSSTTDRGDAEQLAAISTASDVQRMSMELPSGGTASMLVSAEVGQSAIFVHDVNELPDGEVYQAWYVRGNGPISAGVVDAAGDGYRVLDEEYEAGDTIALTVEPKGGSDKPTSDPYFFTASPGTSAA
jgi:anti-sigma-K factor RskA